MLHSEPMCTFCSEWSIMGYGTVAFWDLWNWPIAEIKSHREIISIVTTEYVMLVYNQHVSSCLTLWIFTCRAKTFKPKFDSCMTSVSLKKHLRRLHYRHNSNIRRALVGNNIVDHSDVHVVWRCSNHIFILNTTRLQWIGQRQLVDETRNI